MITMLVSTWLHLATPYHSWAKKTLKPYQELMNPGPQIIHSRSDTTWRQTKLKAPKNQYGGDWSWFWKINKSWTMILPIVVVFLDQLSRIKNCVRRRSHRESWESAEMIWRNSRIWQYELLVSNVVSTGFQTVLAKWDRVQISPILSGQEQLIEISTMRIFHQAGFSLKVWGRIQDT